MLLLFLLIFFFCGLVVVVVVVVVVAAAAAAAAVVVVVVAAVVVVVVVAAAAAVVVVVVVVVVFKGENRAFYNLLTAPRTVSNTYAQVARAQSCANQVQHIERLSRASYRVTCTWYEGRSKPLGLTEFKSHY